MRKKDFDCAVDIAGRYDFTAFGTVTFKPEKKCNDGHTVGIDRGKVEATCAAIRDRVFKRLKCECRWLTSIETGGGEKKIHAHMAIDIPSHLSFELFQATFLEICGRMDWVHDRYELVRISDDDGECGSRKIIFYILKEGVDALALSASTFQVRSTGR